MNLATTPVLGPRLKTLFVAYTHACNSRCHTCDFWRLQHPRQLDNDLLEAEIVESHARGLASVYFTGGEPLLRSNDLFDLADRLRRACPTINLYLLTNGMMLKKHAAGVRGRFSRVIVSLDAPTRELYHAIRGVHSFPAVVAGIRHLRSVAPEVSVRLRTLVLAENVDMLGDVALLARDLGVDRISFLAEDRSSAAFGAAGSGVPMPVAADQTSLVERIDAQIGRIELVLASDPGLPVVPGLTDLRRVRELYRSGSAVAPCNAGELSCVVDADGTVLPCFFIPTEFSLTGATLTEVRTSAAWRDLTMAVAQGKRPECWSCVCPRFDIEDE